ncbi:hypothetical protein [Natronorarus salvus]|uniref:hypothetical protein n=1 Tax=Natronorarus salvus TaxID=3117733 RepID=UPI002F260BDE
MTRTELGLKPGATRRKTWTTSRRGALVLFGGVGMLAGCVGLDEVADGVGLDPEQVESIADLADAESPPGGDGSAAASEGDPPEDAPDGGSEEEWRLYEFEAGERYEYRVHTAEDGPGTFLWSVEEVDGELLTVETSMEFENGEGFSQTVTGTEDDVFSDLMVTPAAVFLWSGLYSPHVGAYEDEAYVGYEWSYSTSEGSFRYAVDGTETYVGTECYVAVTEVDEQVVHESCLSPDLAFPAYVAYYEETGEVAFEMELVGYERD